MSERQAVDLFVIACDAREAAESVRTELAAVTNFGAIAGVTPRELHERIERALRMARRLVSTLEGACVRPS